MPYYDKNLAKAEIFVVSTREQLRDVVFNLLVSEYESVSVKAIVRCGVKAIYEYSDMDLLYELEDHHEKCYDSSTCETCLESTKLLEVAQSEISMFRMLTE